MTDQFLYKTPQSGRFFLAVTFLEGLPAEGKLTNSGTFPPICVTGFAQKSVQSSPCGRIRPHTHHEINRAPTTNLATPWKDGS